jgi:hypothetical protein
MKPTTPPQLPKLQFGFAYWFKELLDVGKQIEPDKYTTDYIAKMEKAWKQQPLTKLQLKVIERRDELQNHKK